MTTFSVLVLVYIVAAFAVGWWCGAAGRRYQYAQGYEAGLRAGERVDDRYPWSASTKVDWSTSRVYGPCADCLDENACFKAAHCMLHEEP